MIAGEQAALFQIVEVAAHGLFRHGERLGQTADRYETAAFQKKLEPVVQRWVEEVGAKGIDGNAPVQQARDLIARHSGQ